MAAVKSKTKGAVVAENKFCRDCYHSKSFDVQWNLNPDGEPITLHCYREKDKVIKGIMRNTIACKHFKPR